MNKFIQKAGAGRGGRRSLRLTTTTKSALNKQDTSEGTTKPEDDNDMDENEEPEEDAEEPEEDAEKPAKVCGES